MVLEFDGIRWRQVQEEQTGKTQREPGNRRLAVRIERDTELTETKES